MRNIKRWYHGLSKESVLYRFPTVIIVKQDDAGWFVQAEVIRDSVEICFTSEMIEK